MHFENAYKQMQPQIVPDEHLLRQTLSAAEPKSRHKPVRLRTVALIAAMVALCMALSLPVLAATETGYALLYAAFPAVAEFFKPIHLSAEDKGIRVEVESIRLQDDTAQIYISVQDLEDDRIDETTELSWHVRPSAPVLYKGTSMESASETLVSYDPETHTARYLLTVTEYTDRRMQASDLLTLRIGSFISGSRELDTELEEIDLHAVDMAPALTIQPTTTYTCSIYDAQDMERLEAIRKNGATFLEPNDPGTPLSAISDTALTGLGYVDGELHIQLRCTGPYFDRFTGNLWIQTADGETLWNHIFAGFQGTDETGTPVCRYDEYIYDISPDALEGCTVYGRFWTCDAMTTGDWAITFPLKETE